MILAHYLDPNGLLKTYDHLNEVSPGAWIRLVAPSDEEIEQVAAMTNIAPSILNGALDEEEAAHLDAEGDVRIIVVDVPTTQNDELNPQTQHFFTVPLAILLNEHYVVTAASRQNLVIPNLVAKLPKGFSLQAPMKFAVQLLYRNASMFVTTLKQVDYNSELIQKRLRESLQNSGLFELMNLSKSLVYLSTGLNADGVVLEKMRALEEVQRTPEIMALLDDAVIENRQAAEMCAIHRDILSGSMDTFASVISNNMNTVMKTLTVLTLVLTIPMMIGGFFGMNFILPFSQEEGFWWAVGGSVVLSLASGVALSKYTSRLKRQNMHFAWHPKKHRRK